jgi:MurNAc alpha-1-phosphate uridylyltransferase
MRPLTDTTPKPLLQVGGRSLIAWHIGRLAQAGITQIVINHAHLGKQIEQALGTGTAFGVSISYSPETSALETAGGIRHALPLLGDAPFLVVNGDVWTDYDFTALQQLNWADGRLAHLVLVNNPPQHPTGDFALDMGKVLSTGTTQYTFSGIGCYQPALFSALPDNQPAKLAPLLREAMQRGQVSGEHYAGEWHDIGTPQRLTELDEALNGRT